MPLQRAWYRLNIISFLLLPVSWLYQLLVFIRRRLYLGGIKGQKKPPLPVVIVGNITVGGTGKSPLIIALVELLQANGFKPGVISRGYGGSHSGEPLSVTAMSDALVVGDEPLMIVQRTGVPLMIGQNRVAAADAMWQSNDVDVILCDDGLQHYPLARDLELSVVDVERQFGNGFCLPAGPLREPVSRLKHVDFVVYNGSLVHQYGFMLEPLIAIPLQGGGAIPVGSFVGQKVQAIAGIGHPQRFFNALVAHGLDVATTAFQDHHQYSLSDFDSTRTQPLLMTEKDAVKCRSLALENAWYVPVSADLTDGLKEDFLLQVNQLRERYRREC